MADRRPPSSPAPPLSDGGVPPVEASLADHVAAYATVLEAEMARGALEAAGIPARVVDAHTVSVAQVLSNAVGGVKVFVAPEDVEEAREILARPAVVDEADLPQGADEPPPAVEEGSRLAVAVYVALVALVAAVIARLAL